MSYDNSNIKIVYVLLDGVGDLPHPDINNKTPLDNAETPNLDLLTKNGKMGQVISVGKALDADPGDQIDKRMTASLERAAFHKTSMLQDLERGRYMEILPIVGAVAELAKLCNIQTPTIDTILALVKLRAKMTGQLPNSLKTK